jgi:hypothetical protein
MHPYHDRQSIFRFTPFRTSNIEIQTLELIKLVAMLGRQFLLRDGKSNDHFGKWTQRSTTTLDLMGYKRMYIFFGGYFLGSSTLTHILCHPICSLAILLRAWTAEILLELNRTEFLGIPRRLEIQMDRKFLFLLILVSGEPFCCAGDGGEKGN